MKICISGPSGVGKTTLAKELADRYSIPFISTSAKELWEKYYIRNHAHLIELCNQDKEFSLGFQYELLEVRVKKLGSTKSYVTDRGILDNITYFLLQNQTLPELEVLRYITTCQKYYRELGYNTIYLGFTREMINGMPIENDGWRITSPLYQRLVDSVFHMVIEDDLLKGTRVPDKNLFLYTWDFKYKLERINQWLKLSQ